MIADQFKTRCDKAWENPGNVQAHEVATEMGAEFHHARGGTTIVEFADGSFALIADNGNAILATWLEEDTEVRK